MSRMLFFIVDWEVRGWFVGWNGSAVGKVALLSCVFVRHFVYRMLVTDLFFLINRFQYFLQFGELP